MDPLLQPLTGTWRRLEIAERWRTCADGESITLQAIDVRALAVEEPSFDEAPGAGPHALQDAGPGPVLAKPMRRK